MSTNLKDFGKIINEFTNDLIITFPDKLLDNLDDNLKLIITFKESKTNYSENKNENNKGDSIDIQNQEYSLNYDLTENNEDNSKDISKNEKIIDNGETDNGETDNGETDNGEIDNGEIDNCNSEYDLAVNNIHHYCSTVLPERFFDIIYQNDEIFIDNSANTKFLPNIEFKELWAEELTDKTRETIWKYLQLLLFSIITNIDNKTTFGDSIKLFEAIDETEFKNKLEETMQGFGNLFDLSSNLFNENNVDMSNVDVSSNIFNNIPNPETIHEHINSIMNGKLGQLAKELAEETAADFDLTDESIKDPNDVFKTLFKNPQKLMKLVKNVGSKLDEKMKSGDIKENELLQEASNMFSHMKNIPGMNSQPNMQDMFANMNIPELMKNMGMMPPGAKFNKNAFNSKMESAAKSSKMKERMRTKLEENKKSHNKSLENDNLENNPNLEKKSSIQNNIQKNLDYIFNSNNSSNELTTLNNDLQNLVEQMKIQNNLQNNQQNNQQNTPRKKKRGKKG
tara:strand:- start:9963 stop:11492 length:1530 start_codon:yes stop_codon:yes gene_type:complete